VKKIIPFSLTILIMLGILLPACSIQSSKNATSGMTIKVATVSSAPPFAWIDSITGETTGLDIDLINAIAKQNNWTIEWTVTTNTNIKSDGSTCSFDLAISNLVITDALKQSFDLSNPYYDTGQVLVVRADELDVSSKEGLSGKLISAVAGSAGEIEAQTVTDAHYRPYDTYSKAFDILLNGQTDAVFADTLVGLSFVQAYPDRLIVVGASSAGDEYGIAICKSRTDLIDPVNNALARVFNDGTMYQLVMKWIGEPSE
jgi:ABC-type amino acid transport substrate-binding protein